MNNIDKVKALVKEIQNLFFIKKYNLIILETKKAIKKHPLSNNIETIKTINNDLKDEY